MSQESPKSNTVLIVIAIIGVVGTIVASAIGAITNYNIEQQRQVFELTRAALISIVTQSGVTQAALQGMVDAPTSTQYPTQTSWPTYTPYPTFTRLPTYTPIPLSPTPSLLLPFSDNFDNGLSDKWETRNGTWRVINGQLAVDSSGIILIGDENWVDYTVDVDFYTFDHNYAVGVIVRENDGNYLYFKANCCDTVWILTNGPDEKVIANTGKRGLAYSGFQGFVKNHFQIVVSGKTYTAYIDGKQFLQVEDSTLKSGRVGFILTDGSGQRIDNLLITSP